MVIAAQRLSNVVIPLCRGRCASALHAAPVLLPCRALWMAPRGRPWPRCNQQNRAQVTAALLNAGSLWQYATPCAGLVLLQNIQPVLGWWMVLTDCGLFSPTV